MHHRSSYPTRVLFDRSYSLTFRNIYLGNLPCVFVTEFCFKVRLRVTFIERLEESLMTRLNKMFHPVPIQESQCTAWRLQKSLGKYKNGQNYPYFHLRAKTYGSRKTLGDIWALVYCSVETGPDVGHNLGQSWSSLYWIPASSHIRTGHTDPQSSDFSLWLWCRSVWLINHNKGCSIVFRPRSVVTEKKHTKLQTTGTDLHPPFRSGLTVLFSVIKTE